MVSRHGRLKVVLGLSTVAALAIGCTNRSSGLKPLGGGAPAPATSGREDQVHAPEGVQSQQNSGGVPSAPQGSTTTAQGNGVDPQDRYPNYKGPTSRDLSDPTKAIVYNGTQEGLVAINGRRLSEVVPPGKAVAISKRYADISGSSGMYNLKITTDGGHSSAGKFNPSTVNEAGWRANIQVNPDNKQLEVKQNAGGGGGDDSGGEEDLENFI